MSKTGKKRRKEAKKDEREEKGRREEGEKEGGEYTMLSPRGSRKKQKHIVGTPGEQHIPCA